MIRRVLVMSLVCTMFIVMSGLAQATTSTTSEAQTIQDLIVKVRNYGAGLNKLADLPIPSGLTTTQKNAFIVYNKWLKTKSSQLYALADKWIKQPPSAQTTQQTVFGTTKTVTVTPLQIMSMELQQIRFKIVSESNQMVQKNSVLKPRHDALLSILEMTGTSASISDILKKTHDDTQNIIRNLSR